MAHAAVAPGSGLGQQLYVARINAKLSAEEVANGAGLTAELVEAFEAGATPTDEDAEKLNDAIAALGGVPGTEPYQPHEPEPQSEEHAEPHVNGWDEPLVENAG
jgi:transcriptional regulator with XRE-family HTH domain